MRYISEDVFFSSYQPVKTMPSVEVLTIDAYGPHNYNDKLMKMTPNVKTFLLMGDESLSFNFQEIYNNFTKLENFGWQICHATRRYLLNKLDSKITGLPEKFCKKMAVSLPRISWLDKIHQFLI